MSLALNKDELAEALGQFFVVGIQGETLDKNEQKLLEELQPGGVILFKRNYSSLRQIWDLNTQLHSILKKISYQQLSPWICVDQEGGRVQRLGDPFTQFPPLKKLGEKDSPKLCFEMAAAQGKELKSVGFNVNFSPVVDVPDSFEAPALGDRILSLDKEKVAQFASAMMRGFLKSEIIGVAKHFPGHGKANVDSHLELPECDASLEELRDLDLVPFRKVIRSKAAGIMSAHISFPKIDREFASSLSQKIIQNLLRNELRYNGLLFSDDMEMGAIVENYSLSDACLQAIMVGTDHVLVCHDLETVLEIKNDILAKLQSGMISLETIKISLDRIIEYKNKFATIETLDFSEVEKIIGCEEHLAIADSIG